MRLFAIFCFESEKYLIIEDINFEQKRQIIK